MSNTSTASESYHIISNSNADERINNVSKLGKDFVHCCPECKSASFYYRNGKGNYICTHCKTIFATPGTLKIRTQKCCPHCGSVAISRRKTKHSYHCEKCLSDFSNPAFKIVRANGRYSSRDLAVSTFRRANKLTGAV